jgi:ATP-dependent DNA helicase PIF1
MLSHSHRVYNELLTIDGIRFDSYKTAYLHCQQHHEHEDDHYGDVENIDPDADPEEWEPRMGDDDITLEDWQELARLVPDLEPEQEAADLLGRRDIDINYDWSSHVNKYRHNDFLDGKYWTNLRGETIVNNDVEYMPPEARNTLNSEQRLVYDTVIGHFQQRDAPPIRLQVDGGGGTGKSYMVKVLSSHLQQASLSGKSPILRAAPTGVASNQINGQTLHSLLRLPIEGQYRPLTDTPSVLSNLQRVFNGVKYLVIDEKSMLGLKTLAWIDQRLREVFPRSGNEFFGGLSVLLIGDFFQLPPVLNKPLYTDCENSSLKDYELLGRNAYRSFTNSVFLTTVQRQFGDDQAAFRQALLELREAKVSAQSWKLLSSRCAVMLSQHEQKSFIDAVRIYPTKARVTEYNYQHLIDLNSPVLNVAASHEGVGAAAAESKDAGNLSKSFPVCVGCRVMLTRNLWNSVGLVNGAQGSVYDIGWADGANSLEDPPLVIMVAFDKYQGPAFLKEGEEELRDLAGRFVVPILHVQQDFTLKNRTCSRKQFPLIVSYAITVHKSQSITLDKMVCDISSAEFTSGLSYVTVSRVSKLQGLMLDATFERSRVCHDPPTRGT